MMALHHNYQVTWGAEKMEGLTLDLGLDGTFSPLPAELNPVVTKDSEPSSWRFFGQQQTTDDNLGCEDPCDFLYSSNCGQSERKPDMFELSLSSYPPQARHHQQLLDMKVEQKDVEPRSLATDIVPSAPSVEDLSSQRDGPVKCWRNSNTEVLRRKELHLYGTPGDENSPVELRGDDTESDDFSEIKANRGVSSNVPTPFVQEQHRHQETIVIDDDDTDDDFLFEVRYTEEDDRSVSPLPCGDHSRPGSQERRGFTAVSLSLPLREIKRNVLRSIRSDEDFACLTPSSSSAVPVETTRQHYSSLKDIYETCDLNHHHQQQQGTSTNSKRGRGYGDHNWLPSDLLDTSQSDERRNEAKRVRRNDADEPDSQAQKSSPIIDDSDISMKEPGRKSDGNQGIQSMPQIDVNQAIQVMPQDTAEAFKELIRLVEASESRASLALDEHWRYPLASDVDFFPPPSSATVKQPSRTLEEMMENMKCDGSDLHHIDPLPTPTTVNQAFPLLEDLESHSMTSSEFQLNSSPTLATVDQPFFAYSPCHPSESANQSQCTPHRAVHEQHHAPIKRTSNADVVLYEPKPELVEAWRDNTSGPVVHVKQELGLHYQDSIPSDRVTIRPIDESAGAVGECFSPNRNLILAALNTFEQVRLQIMKDPTYGQDLLEKSQTSSKGIRKGNRTDQKAACLMGKKGFWVNDRVRPIGEVPGVVNGDYFTFRTEMFVIGLHRATQAGIAVVHPNHSPYGKPVASSVVLGVSHLYRDDKDMGDKVEYSGQGGLRNRTKEAQDQKLERGNLALSNSYELKLPVRFIRGYKQQNSRTGILYSYDGLYQVVDMKYVIGVRGKKVFKFILHRIHGQPPIRIPGQHASFSGYPAPLGSQVPVRDPPQDAVHWTESADVQPLYLENRPVT